MKKSLGLLCLMFLSSTAHAGYSISAGFGKNFTNSVQTEENLKIELEDDSHFTVSLDRTIDNARYGFFYSATELDMKDQTNKQVEMQYLLFQSAVEVPLADRVVGFVGAQIGANHVSTDFADSDTFFTSGLYAGADYLITEQARVYVEARWLATIVNNASNVSCTLPTSEDDQCLWHFDGDVLNQFQTNIGFSYRF